MTQLEITGLEIDSAQKTAEKLNHLLADYHIYYMSLRGLHWNIVGNQFFALHEKFEELYDNVADKIDEIAERILMLEQKPVHSLTEFVKMAKLKEVVNVNEAKPAIEAVLHGFKHIIAMEREILEFAGKSNDEATVAMMSDYISEQEKLVWMFSAILK